MSRESGLSLEQREETLYRWREELLAGGRERLGKKVRQAGVAERRIARLEKELARRAQVIGELSIANGISEKLQAYPD